jgi:thiamine pyrophosphokinase
MSTPEPSPTRPRHVLVVADGDVPSRPALDAAWPAWDDRIAFVIAADGGYGRATAMGLQPDVLVGDLDSLDLSLIADAERRGIPIRRANAAKDESDAELALLEAVARGADEITVLGAFGGPRLDHALANVWLLAHPGLAGVAVALLDARSRVTAIAAPDPAGRPLTRAVRGPVGGAVSLLPLAGDVEGITTSGLRYPLLDEPLRVGPARGLSNVREAPDASVTVRSGTLLVVEGAPEPAGLSSDDEHAAARRPGA